MDTREIFLWHGRNPDEDAKRLTAAVAAKTAGELFRVDGSVNHIRDGNFVMVNKYTMAEIVARHIRTCRLVNRGTDAEPKWEVEFYAFAFPASGNLAQGPNEKTLIDMMTALVPLVASGPTRAHDFSAHDLREIQMRLKQGDPPRLLARKFGCEIDTIRAIDREMVR
jgi:hypothetical protein